MNPETEQRAEALQGAGDRGRPCFGAGRNASTLGDLPERCTRIRKDLYWRRLRRKLPVCLLLPLVILGAVTALHLGWEWVEARWLAAGPSAASPWVVVARIGVCSAAISALVYFLVCRDRKRLSGATSQLAGLLEDHVADPESERWFENPNLLHCKDVLDCEHEQCPMRETRGKRCWQEMALGAAAEGLAHPRVEIAKCHDCEVFRLSCGDGITELGERINNLLFLLRAEGRSASEMRAQLVEREKMFSIGQLASGIAHEVGNPLSSISSIVQVLKRSGMNGETGEQLDLIQTHIQRISKTVHQLVNLARRRDDNWVMIDVGRALGETVRLISFDPRARNVDIDFETPPPGLRAQGIAGQVEQVFLNLSLNALDAMPNGGRLRIRAHRNRTNIVAEFEDTGHGIEPDVARRMFDPFFSTKDPGSGTGLGLAVSFSIVQKLKGTLDYESSVGEGTVFRVNLPIPVTPVEKKS